MISCELRTVGPAFALQQPRCFLTAESISLGKVGESGNLVKGQTSADERNSHYAVALEFRLPRATCASNIVSAEVLPTVLDQYTIL